MANVLTTTGAVMEWMIAVISLMKWTVLGDAVMCITLSPQDEFSHQTIPKTTSLPKCALGHSLDQKVLISI